MAVIIGSARHDENGRYANGVAGDQTGQEVSTQNFYLHSKGWYVLRPKSAVFAERIATRMLTACNNKNLGYDQNNRLGVVKYGIDTKTPTECDCSSLVRQCVKEGTSIDPGNFTTANEVSALLATGLFDKLTYKSGMPLYSGDILVTKQKGHTAIVTTGEPKNVSQSTNPYVEPKTNIKKGSKGVGVMWVQYELNRHGAKLDVDGIAGAKTDKAIRDYQRAHGLTVDGIVGQNTRNSLKVI